MTFVRRASGNGPGRILFRQVRGMRRGHGAQSFRRGFATPSKGGRKPNGLPNAVTPVEGASDVDGAVPLFSSPETLRSQAEALIHAAGNPAQSATHAFVRREPFLHFVVRWADVFGFFSRWNNRQYWCLSSPPLMRLAAPMVTEWERKMYLFREVNFQLTCCGIGGLLGLAYYYRNARMPLPETLGMEGRFKGNWGYLSNWPLQYPKKRCPGCLAYDPECKKLCFEKLRAAGHKLFLDDTFLRAWATPRIDLKPPPAS